MLNVKLLLKESECFLTTDHLVSKYYFELMSIERELAKCVLVNFNDITAKKYNFILLCFFSCAVFLRFYFTFKSNFR